MEIVKRTGRVLYKRPKNEQEVRFLRRHHECLLRLEGLGVAPKSLILPNVVYGTKDLWAEEDLGDSQPVTDEVEFARGCVHLLASLHDKGIHHADLTRHNIVVRDNKPYAVDFHESLLHGEDATPKRPEGDAYWVWHAASELSPDTTRRIRRWRAIRPHLVPNTTLIDFGTAMGDFLAMAEVEYINLRVLGYDNNSQEDWTNRSQSLNIVNADINTLPYPYGYSCHTALFMSVYPHIVKASGYEVAFHTLKNIIAGSKQAFIEFQLEGDGIGEVTQFKGDEHVYDFLINAMRGTRKQIERVTTIPVHGREPYTRTVWRIYDERG